MKKSLLVVRKLSDYLPTFLSPFLTLTRKFDVYESHLFVIGN